MTKTLRSELEQSMVSLCDRLDMLQSDIGVLVQRVEVLRRIVEPRIGTAVMSPHLPRPLLNGSWPQRDGNTYPRIQGKPPIGGYESYVRRSPPAKE